MTLRSECPLETARAWTIVKAVEAMGTIQDSQALYDALQRGLVGHRLELVMMTSQPAQTVKERLLAIPDVERVDATSTTTPRHPMSPAPARLGPPTTAPGAARPEEVPKPDGRMVRIASDQLDQLMDLVGELVLTKARLFQLGDALEHKPLQEALSQMGRITDALQADLLQARLVPIASIVNRFPRMVRDLARAEQKTVEIVLEGGESGLDRTILEKLHEPLVHLLRNAVSHGIEPSAERVKRGKPPTGTIRLTAQRERNVVVIDISDDGSGMDVAQIKRAAVEQGLLTSEDAAALRDEDALMIITRPGFSTSSAVTQASGRGVGLDVVRTTVESLGGSMRIASQPGTGSTLTLRLPLVLSIMPALLVQVNTETYAIPLTNILETVKVARSVVRTMAHHEVMPYHETVLPLIRLQDRLGHRDTNGEPFSSMSARSGGVLDQLIEESVTTAVRDSRMSVVVVEVGHRKAGLVVDALLTQQETVIKAVPGRLRTMPGLAGATILDDGRAAMILDVASMV